MERLFISLSHLQHSDTAAVKDSFPPDTSSGRNDIKSKAQQSYNQTIHHLCMHVTAAVSNNCVLHLKLPWLFKEIK